MNHRGEAPAPGDDTANWCDAYLAHVSQLTPADIDVLSDAELARRARLVRQEDKDRFTLAAALLRSAVACATGLSSGEVQIDRSCEICGADHGRPRLEGLGPALSVSHSGEWVAVAVSGAGAVGIDVEQLSNTEWPLLVRQVCTPSEAPHVVDTPTFYSYWTRKEAFLKATGEGLRRPMTDIAVTAPEDPARLLGTVGQEATPACQMLDLPTAPGYLGCVVVLSGQAVDWRLTQAQSGSAGITARA